MRRLLLSVIFITLGFVAFGQIIKTEDLEAYANIHYGKGKEWVAAADTLYSSGNFTLDKNGGLTIVEVIPAEGKTKEQLYVLMNYWYVNSFNDAESVIQLNDKDAGTIIARGYVSNMIHHTGLGSEYFVSIHPIIKTDIRDGKIRVTYTVPYYDISSNSSGGGLAITAAALGGGVTPSNWVAEKWLFEDTFPFIDRSRKETKEHKKTSAKGFIMTYAYSNVILDKIKEAITNGVVGNEGDEW